MNKYYTRFTTLITDKLFLPLISILLIFFFALPTSALAIPVAYNLNVTIIEDNANVGTGVSIGDMFTGVMYFDDSELLPDGSRTRSIIYGGDSITVAGITFDDTLASDFYAFEFAGGAPLCIGDFSLDGCGTGEGQSIPKPDLDDLIFYDNFLGRVRDYDESRQQYEFASFSYEFELASVPEPSTLVLLAFGLIGVFRRHLYRAI